MDSIKQQKLRALTKFKGSHHPVKGTFQILLSISLFFLFFLSYSSSWAPTSNTKSYKPLVSVFTSKYRRFDLNRNLMFLLFNAIVVFVTGGFGYFRVSSKAEEDIHSKYLARCVAHHPPVPVPVPVSVEDKEIIVESVVLVENDVTDKEVIITDTEEKEATTTATAAADDKENHYNQHHLYQPYHHGRSRPHDHHHHHHQRHRRCRQHRKRQQQHHDPQLHRPQEEEEENENENCRLQQQEQDERGWLVIIEESDKRFDDFIKQVKEGMRMEAKQLLLTA